MANKPLFHRLVGRFRKNRSFMSLLDSTGEDISGKKWVFIIGCYNSGTTLLEEVLAMHPAMSSLQEEGVVLTDKLVRPEDFGWRRMWHACEGEMKIKEEDAAEIAKRVKRHWSHFYNLKKPVLLEKSIANTTRMEFLNRHFKDAYFIHLVRDGHAVSEGIRRQAKIMEENTIHKGVDKYPIELCAQQWARSLELVEQTKSKVDHFFELTYESFTENPDQELRKITDFIGVEPFKDTFKDKVFSIHGVDSSIKNMNARSIARLTDHEIKFINKAAGHYLKKYGYQGIANI